MIVWKHRGAARHGRPKTIARAERTCNVCGGNARMCLGFDSSDEEYGAVWICEECAHKGFCGDKMPPPPKEPYDDDDD